MRRHRETCATLGLIACVDELHLADGACGDVPHPTFGQLTALPPANDFLLETEQSFSLYFTLQGRPDDLVYVVGVRGTSAGP